MKATSRKFCFAGFLFFLSLAMPVFAQSYSEGGVIVPVADGLPSSTFNLNTDAASIFLEKAIIFRNNGWFTNDKEIAITCKMTINSQKREDRTAASLAISRIFKFDISNYEEGSIEIPLKSLPILDTFKLSGEKYAVTSIVLNISLSKKKEKSSFSKVLEKLMDVSKKIPVPGNPYAEYASVFGDTFSEVLDEAIKEGADTVPFASFGLRFLQGQQASSFTEKPGLHAIILGSTSTEKGVIQLDKLNGKNLSFDTTRGLLCEGEKVKNNHLIVRVTSSTDPFSALLEKVETIKRLSHEAPAAVAYSEGKGLPVATLKQITDLTQKGDFTALQKLDVNVVQQGLSELNSIRGHNPFKH